MESVVVFLFDRPNDLNPLQLVRQGNARSFVPVRRTVWKHDFDPGRAFGLIDFANLGFPLRHRGDQRAHHGHEFHSDLLSPSLVCSYPLKFLPFWVRAFVERLGCWSWEAGGQEKQCVVNFFGLFFVTIMHFLSHLWPRFLVVWAAWTTLSFRLAHYLHVDFHFEVAYEAMEGKRDNESANQA